MLYTHSTLYTRGRNLSFGIGLPVGLAVILLLGPTKVFRGFADTLFETILYTMPIVPLIIAFTVGLWYACKNIPLHLAGYGYGVLTTSFFFSLYVNAVFWATYLVVTTRPSWWWEEPIKYLAPAVLWFNCSVYLTTFTVGYLICWIIKRQMFAVANGWGKK